MSEVPLYEIVSKLGKGVRTPPLRFLMSEVPLYEIVSKLGKGVTLHPTPYALHTTHYTLHPTPYALHTTHCTRYPCTAPNPSMCSASMRLCPSLARR